MKMKKILLILPLLLLSSILASATIYSDAEKGDIDGWIVYDNSPAGATITNVKDNYSHVIEFKGKGRRNAYLIGSTKSSSKSWNDKSKKISWDMKFNEKFKFALYISTKKGKRIIIYDYKNKDKGLYKKKYIRIGLGKKTKTNQWIHIERNIVEDLKKYEPDNKFMAIYGFKVQGSGRIDNLLTDGNISHLNIIPHTLEQSFNLLHWSDTVTLENGTKINASIINQNNQECHFILTDITDSNNPTILSTHENNCISSEPQQIKSSEVFITPDAQKAYVIIDRANMTDIFTHTFLLVFNISNPTSPIKLSETDLEIKKLENIHILNENQILIQGWNGNDDANSCDQYENYARIIDITNSTNPSLGDKFQYAHKNYLQYHCKYKFNITGISPQMTVFISEEFMGDYQSIDVNLTGTPYSAIYNGGVFADVLSDTIHDGYVSLGMDGIEVVDFTTGTSQGIIQPDIGIKKMIIMEQNKLLIFNENEAEYITIP